MNKDILLEPRHYQLAILHNQKVYTYTFTKYLVHLKDHYLKKEQTLKYLSRYQSNKLSSNALEGNFA